MARAKKRKELARAVRRARLLRREVVVVESDRGDAGRDGDRRPADGDDGRERAVARGLGDGRRVADGLAAHGDGDRQRVARERALDRVRGARVVAELVLLEHLADLLGAAVELGLGRDLAAGGAGEGVRQRGGADGRVARCDGACRSRLALDEVGGVRAWQGEG